MAPPEQARRRALLNRDRVLRAAVTLADDGGHRGAEHAQARPGTRRRADGALQARRQQGRAARRHGRRRRRRDRAAGPRTDWKNAVRRRILSARRALLRHPWASRVIESRTTPTPAVLGYMDSMHRHVPRRRLLRRPHPSRDARPGQPHVGVHPGAVRRPTEPSTRRDRQPCSARWPAATPTSPSSPSRHRPRRRRRSSGSGCDDQFEFEFALDLLLDGFERLQQQGWTSTDHVRRGASDVTVVTGYLGCPSSRSRQMRAATGRDDGAERGRWCTRHLR